MRIDRPTTRFSLATRCGVLVLIAGVIGMTGVLVLAPAPADAQVVTLQPTSLALDRGISASGTATIEVVNPTKTKVTFDLSGIPGGTCIGLKEGGSLLSGWLLIDPAERGNNMVERWGPPPTFLGTVAGDQPLAGGGTRDRCPSAAYPAAISKNAGATDAGCFPMHPNIRLTTPLAKTLAHFTRGMGGTSDPDPHGFTSDRSGEAFAQLKTDFDFTDGQSTTPLVLREAPAIDETFMLDILPNTPAPPLRAPGFFGSSVPPFHAQCTTLNTPPAPPVCAARGGVLRGLQSSYKRVYTTYAFTMHIGPNGERLPSNVPGIGQTGVANSLGEVNEFAFGRGNIHDIDGPCDNNLHPSGTPGPPCGAGTFTRSSEFTLEERQPLDMSRTFDTSLFRVHPASSDGGKGQRFIASNAKGGQVLARGVAAGIGVALHHDCLTHGHIPGNPQQANGDVVFPAEYTMILIGALP